MLAFLATPRSAKILDKKKWYVFVFYFLTLQKRQINSFLLVFREWMLNKRSIPRMRTTLAFLATPRSAKILDKKQWYVFVFYFLTLQKRQINSFLLVFRKWRQNKRSTLNKRKTLAFPATPRSVRILDKRQWYVFVFYSFTLQKRQINNSFLLVFREWMLNKRSIPRMRTTLAFLATPRSAKILDKKQWYVFVFYFLTLQKRQINSFLLVFRKWRQNKRSTLNKRKTLAFPATPRSVRILVKAYRYVYVLYIYLLFRKGRLSLQSVFRYM